MLSMAAGAYLQLLSFYGLHTIPCPPSEITVVCTMPITGFRRKTSLSIHVMIYFIYTVM